MFSFAQLSPCGLGFRLCAGLGRVEGLLVCLQDARRQPSQKTTVNQAIAEFRRAPGYGCLNMGAGPTPGLGLATVWPEEHGLPGRTGALQLF